MNECSKSERAAVPKAAIMRVKNNNVFFFIILGGNNEGIREENDQEIESLKTINDKLEKEKIELLKKVYDLETIGPKNETEDNTETFKEVLERKERDIEALKNNVKIDDNAELLSKIQELETLNIKSIEDVQKLEDLTSDLKLELCVTQDELAKAQNVIKDLKNNENIDEILKQKEVETEVSEEFKDIENENENLKRQLCETQDELSNVQKNFDALVQDTAQALIQSEQLETKLQQLEQEKSELHKKIEELGTINRSS